MFPLDDVGMISTVDDGAKERRSEVAKLEEFGLKGKSSGFSAWEGKSNGGKSSTNLELQCALGSDWTDLRSGQEYLGLTSAHGEKCFHVLDMRCHDYRHAKAKAR